MTILHIALVFLLGAALVSIIAERLRLPYTVALVIAGALAGLSRIPPSVALTPDVLLTLVIPPLLFEGSLRLSVEHLRTYAMLIGLLAIVGTIAAALAIAWAAAVVGHLSVPTALLLGAIAAAIDPVSVIALIQEAGLDARLGTILQAEAVLNDGVVVVLFTILTGPAALVPLAAAGQFLWLLGVGGLVGLALGVAIAHGLGRVTTQPLVEALGSLILLVASVVVAGSVGASGIVAVMCAGVVFTRYRERMLTEAGREIVGTLWDVVAFLANSALFLFIGLQVPVALLVRYWGLIAVVVIAALAIRALVVYGFAALSERRGMPVPRSWRPVLVWGGVRGGVAIALVLDLAAGLPERDAVAAAVFGLVVFTLLGQGLSMPALMRRVGVLRD